ncbi:hypothetical protein BD309DRAFT_1084323 [Dichomitus squalens]|nr:hypothetical protein BD309DRAFT_1084323 [Dichomitus squalens]
MKFGFNVFIVAAALVAHAAATPAKGPIPNYATTVTETFGGTTITLTETIDPPGSFPTGR